MKTKILFLITFLVSFYWGTNTIVQANQVNPEFNVTINPNSHQLDPSKSYFDMQLAPQQKTVISINLTNESNKTQRYEIQANPAITNSNLNIDYSPQANEKSLIINQNLNLKKLIKNPVHKITLKPHQTHKVSFNLTAPKHKYQGVILGGIYVHPENPIKNKQEINNQFNIITAVVIRQNKLPDKPNLNLTAINSKINQQLEFKLSNPSNNYLNDVATRIKIYKKNQLIANIHNQQQSIAPNSKINYPVPIDKYNLAPGKYQVTFKINGKHHFQQSWNKSFEIKNYSNVKNTKIKTKDNFPQWKLAAIILLIIIFLLIVIVKMNREIK